MSIGAPTGTHLSPGDGTFQTADGAILAYRIVGEGVPIIFSHPYVAHPEVLPGGAVGMAMPICFIMLDPRGLGASAPARDASELGMERLAEDYEELRLHLGIERWIVHGRAEGACVALLYATRYPAAVDALVLFSPAASYHYLTAQEGLFDPAHPAFRALNRTLWALLADPTDENLLALHEAHGELLLRARERAMGDEPPPPPVPWPAEAKQPGTPLREAPLSGMPVRFQRFLLEIFRYDVREQLPLLAVPALVIAGRYDPICPVAYSEEVARLIPGADLVICEEGTHTLLIEEGATVLWAVGQFLRQYLALSAAPSA